MTNFDDRIVVITAGASGMGAAGSRLFAARGATVVIADINEHAARTLAEEIRGAGGVAEPFVVDVSDVGQIRSLFDFIGTRFGRLNVLWNHAGIPGPAGMDVSPDEFDRTVAINARSAFFATQFALDLLRRGAPGSSLLFTSSVSGLSGSMASPIYSLTKFGVVGFMRSLAIVLAKEGIRCNAICPGPMATPMLPEFIARGADVDVDESLKAVVSMKVPAGRTGQPDEVAQAAVWLSSAEASYITGVALPVDGGYLA